MRASTAVFITALAASSLAAPVFIDGENKNTVEERGIGKVVGKVAKHLEKQGGHYKSIAKAGAGVYNAVSSRDLEELEGLDERNLFGFAKKLFHHGGKHAANNAANNNGQQQPQQRSLEDDGYELTERDFEELAELDERALDEYLSGLDERGIFHAIGKLFHHGGKHAANNAANNNDQQQPQQRSLEDDDYELTERDFEELAELDERALDEYLSGLDERGIFHAIGKLFHHGGKHAADNNGQQQQQRSLEELDDEPDFEMRDVDEFDITMLGRSVPEDELEWTVDMRDVEAEEGELEDRSKIGNFFKKIGKGFKKAFTTIL